MTEVQDSTQGLDFLHQLNEGFDQETLELSRSLVNSLYVLFRSATTHNPENAVIDRVVEQLKRVIDQHFESGLEQLEISLMDGNFFVNGRLLQLDYSTFQNTRYLRRFFDFLDIDEMIFGASPTTGEVRSLFAGFLQMLRKNVSHISEVRMGNIRLGRRKNVRFQELFGEDDPRHHVLGVYASGLLMLRQFVNDLRKGQKPRYPKIKRLCLQLIDLEPRYHSLLLALIHLRGYKGNLFCRMLNTAVLSIAFGQRIGLNRTQLLDLGMTAFYHDLGWALLGTLDNQSDNSILTIDGINQVKNSSDPNLDNLRVKVARALVRIGGFNELIINRLIVAYETQIPEESYPRNLYYGEIGANYMTHVIRMASRYDALTSGNEGRDGHLPDTAMREILDDNGRRYNPFLAKIFSSSIGAFPVGSFVELTTGEFGLVVNLPVEPIHFNRPQVKVLVDRSGQKIENGPIVDLSQKDRSGQFLRSVERTYDARSFGINITNFFFGDE